MIKNYKKLKFQVALKLNKVNISTRGQNKCDLFNLGDLVFKTVADQKEPKSK